MSLWILRILICCGDLNYPKTAKDLKLLSTLDEIAQMIGKVTTHLAERVSGMVFYLNLGLHKVSQN